MSDGKIIFPELIEFNDFGGDYDEYEKALLEQYEMDLWKGGLVFNNLPVKPRVHQRFELNGKVLDWTFAHFTSRGKIEENRELDLRRCERIGWVKCVIENAHLDCVKVWVNHRKDKKGKSKASIVFWCEDARIKVVITKVYNRSRDSYHYVITTFYLINNPIKIQRHNEEYENYVSQFGKFDSSHKH